MKSTTSKPDLSNLERIAIACSVGSADKIGEFKKDLATGVYNGHLAIEIDFSITKESGYWISPTVNLLSKAVIARALVLMGVQRDHFLSALRSAALASLVGGTEVADEIVGEDARVQEQLKALEDEVVLKLPKQPRSGKTLVKAEVKKIVAQAVVEETKEAQAS